MQAPGDNSPSARPGRSSPRDAVGRMPDGLQHPVVIVVLDVELTRGRPHLERAVVVLFTEGPGPRSVHERPSALRHRLTVPSSTRAR